VKTTGNDALYQQEYYCSFDVPIQGAYYGDQLMKAIKDGRITKVPVEMSVRVDTYWDLGIGDSTSIWFVQQIGKEIRIVDFYETSGEGLAHYAKILDNKGYVYGSHWAPHDIEVRELGSGKSRLEMARKLGIKFRIVPKISIDDGINAARTILNQCWFDEDRCKLGINALKSYHKEWDEKNKVYKDRPHHDWSSHASDAFRYFGVAHKDQSRRSTANREVKRPKPVNKLTGY